MAARLKTAFGDAVTEIEHLGSTSVPGTLAKPVIDSAATLEVAAGKAPGLTDDASRQRGLSAVPVWET